MAKKSVVLCVWLAIMGGTCRWTPPALAAPVFKTGAISKFSGVHETASVCTTSSTFVTMPSMTLTFTQGGTSADEVVVMFQGGGWFVESSNFVEIRLLIDNVTQPGPGAGVFIYGSDPNIDTQSGASHGFNFQSNLVNPGNRTAKIQWRSFSGGEVCVADRSLLILHR